MKPVSRKGARAPYVIHERTTKHGAMLTELRIEAGMTVGKASEMSGVPDRTNNRIELGKTLFNFETLVNTYGYRMEIRNAYL